MPADVRNDSCVREYEEEGEDETEGEERGRSKGFHTPEQAALALARPRITVAP